MYHVFTIRASGLVRHVTQPKAPTLDQLQGAVGGYIETVPGFTKFVFLDRIYTRGRAYADEEGKLKGKQYNQRATAAWHEQQKGIIGHDSLVGDVVFYTKGRD